MTPYYMISIAVDGRQAAIKKSYDPTYIADLSEVMNEMGFEHVVTMNIEAIVDTPIVDRRDEIIAAIDRYAASRGLPIRRAVICIDGELE